MNGNASCRALLGPRRRGGRVRSGLLPGVRRTLKRGPSKADSPRVRAGVNSEVDDLLDELDQGLKRLRMEYEQFFMGAMKREPQVLRSKIQKIVIRLVNEPPPQREAEVPLQLAEREVPGLPAAVGPHDASDRGGNLQARSLQGEAPLGSRDAADAQRLCEEAEELVGGSALR